MEYIILIIWLHFVGDFILQLDKMALSKSNSNSWLLLHCLIYSIPFLIFGIEYALLVGGSHFIVDFVTSKISKYYWLIKNQHMFFVIIGLDQAIHVTVLLLTLNHIG